MDPRSMDGDQRKAFLASIFLILIWITIPLYMQLYHGYSAVQISFAITVIYYIGFKLWKRYRRKDQ